MFVFKKEQQSFDFGGVTIGGHPGKNPTALVGGLFFTGQPIVENTKEGLFDKKLTSEWVHNGLTMVEKTGHPLIVQLFGRTPLAMENHITWITENFDVPFMFESTNVKARMRGIEYCEEAGLRDRAIFNSINTSLKDEEKELLSNSSLNMAVVLGWSPRATSLPDRMDTVRITLDEAYSLGIEKVLIDPATMPVGAGYGLDYRTVLAIKSELGLPTCLGPHNAPSAWKFIRQPDLDVEKSHLASVLAATAAAQLLATDCIMYGSMIRTKEVFVAVALIGNAIASMAAEANQAMGIERELFEPLSFE